MRLIGQPSGPTLGLYCWLLPCGTVIVCALWSMRAGLAPTCFPLLEGCASISAMCRSVPVVYLFRTLMLPACVLLAMFWWHNHLWLMSIAPERAGRCRFILGLSMVGSAFLVLYVIFLGTDGRVYEFLRRLGIYVFFGGTAIAQLLTTQLVRRSLRSVLDRAGSAVSAPVSAPLALRTQSLIVLAMLVAGPMNLVFKAVLAEPDRIENVIEWNFGLILFLWYSLQGRLMAG